MLWRLDQNGTKQDPQDLAATSWAQKMMKTMEAHLVELLVGFEKLVNRKRFLVPVLLVSEVQSIQ